MEPSPFGKLYEALKVKVGVFGDKCAGKSTLIKTLANKRHLIKLGRYLPTKEQRKINFETKVQGRKVEVSFVDVPGSEPFDEEGMATFEESDIVVFAYSITSSRNYKVVKSWIEENCELFVKSKTFILAATMGELENKRAISYFEAQNFAYEHGMRFFETSVSEGFHIREMIDFMVRSQARRDSGNSNLLRSSTVT